MTISVIGRKKRKNNGFTLIELVLVLSIAIILILLSMPTFSKVYMDTKLKNSVQGIAWTLRYAYQSAITEGVRYRAHFDVLSGIYWLEKQQEGSLSTFAKINTALVKEKILPAGISFKSAELVDIIMSPSGFSDSASIYVTDDKDKVYTIFFSGLTGQVTVLDYEKQRS